MQLNIVIECKSCVIITITINNRQLLDEVEHDIMNFQDLGLSYLPKLETEADKTDLRFDNSWYPAKI